ncbi:class I SAM-dependent methyltransferase [Salipiger mangrovisoli]|uniref:Class I SAM-dependent methyltransferase n=1 Tax=Salipiger mangrovisoli TaxID=2865933 RepID=A0ABR9WYE5_9RHOB|nr:class I SAM-dependent methyltransferase [Salipiger mangrovisoli]MBE9636314.1 class I SAM-dependent methyltransferase [Salipiger mangrovisoli]
MASDGSSTSQPVAASTPSQEGAQAPRIHISCLIDNEPRFRMQAWNWLLSLRALETTCKIFVHHLPGAVNENLQDAFRALGAHLIEVPAFGDGAARFSNKINQLESPEFLDADFVILSDADIVFLDDPAKLVEDGKFRAKPVDLPHPPLPALRELFHRAGFGDDLRPVPVTMEPGSQTSDVNFNGGLYVMPASVAQTLAPLWAKHARFVLEQVELLPNNLHNADQVGMGLALLEAGAEISPLPDGANLPTHLGLPRLSRLEAQPVSALHYHAHSDNHGLPVAVGNLPWIDQQIGTARSILTEQRRAGFLNEIFWDFRYQMFPELGSGLGSRGEVLMWKQSLMRPYLAMMGDHSLLDVGCGDLEVYHLMDIKNYTGLDLSEKALEIARGKRPDWTYIAGTIDRIDGSSYDYCSCIDVLIHQPSLDAARALATHLVRVARKGILFSAHSEAEQRTGISFESSSLWRFMADLPEISEVHAVGSYRDTTLYFAQMNTSG